MDKGLRLTSEDTIIGMDLGSRSHQVVVIDGKGKRLTSFRIGHSREGLAEMVRRVKVSRAKLNGRVTYGFEATRPWATARATPAKEIA